MRGGRTVDAGWDVERADMFITRGMMLLCSSECHPLNLALYFITFSGNTLERICMSRAACSYEVYGRVPSSSESVMLKAHRNNSLRCSESSWGMGATQKRFPVLGSTHYFCLNFRIHKPAWELWLSNECKCAVQFWEWCQLKYGEHDIAARLPSADLSRALWEIPGARPNPSCVGE